MGVKLILSLVLIFVLLFIVSCSSKSYANLEPKLYIVGESNPIVFVAGEKSNIAWIDATKHQRHELNTIRALREYEDDLEEFYFDSKLSNVRRIVVNELGQSKLIVGYEEEIDNPGFEEIR